MTVNASGARSRTITPNSRANAPKAQNSRSAAKRSRTGHLLGAIQDAKTGPGPVGYERADALAAQAESRPDSSGTAAPTSTTASAGTFARLAAATIASADGASYRQYVRRRSALRNEKTQRTPSSALISSIDSTSSLVRAS